MTTGLAPAELGSNIHKPPHFARRQLPLDYQLPWKVSSSRRYSMCILSIAPINVCIICWSKGSPLLAQAKAPPLPVFRILPWGRVAEYNAHQTGRESGLGQHAVQQVYPWPPNETANQEPRECDLGHPAASWYH